MRNETLSDDDRHKIAELVNSMTLPKGLGDKYNACSIAAINLALTGELHDGIPDCMSKVLGKWIIKVQDSISDGMRNDPRWKSMLPLAAGTGREKEKERLDIIMEWMWDILSKLQPMADERGFGKEWSDMITSRNADAAAAAAAAADAAATYAAADAATYAADAADIQIWTEETVYETLNKLIEC